MGDLGSIPGLGRSPGGRLSSPVQYPCLENHHRQRNLVGYNPWGLKESDMTQQLSMHSTAFTFGDLKSLMAVTFLAHQYGGKYFISQK